MCFAHALCEKRKYFTDYGSGFFVNDKMPFHIGVLFISIECKRTYVHPSKASRSQYAFDILRHIFQIPLVYQTVYLPGFFVPLVGGICVIDNTDKSDSPDRKQSMDILFDKFHFTGKSGLGFTEDYVEFVLLCGIDEFIELRPVSV